MTTAMTPAKALDASFLIDMWLAGGEEAIEAVLGNLGQKSFVTDTILGEVSRNDKLSLEDLKFIVTKLRTDPRVTVIDWRWCTDRRNDGFPSLMVARYTAALLQRTDFGRAQSSIRLRTAQPMAR